MQQKYFICKYCSIFYYNNELAFLDSFYLKDTDIIHWYNTTEYVIKSHNV